MSHPEQLAFFEAVARRNPELVSGARVLEIGSFDVNGSIRGIFSTAGEYVGVDLTEGPGVDVVGFGHEVDQPDGSYALAVSGECFEHDPHWRETFANMVRLTRPGGLVAFTCASRGRPEHGTRRSDVTDSPGTQAEGLDYYRNLTDADFDALPLSTWFSEWRFWYMPTTFDLYFAGIRLGGESAGMLPTDGDVRPIRRLLPLAHRMIRLPLRLTATVVRDEDTYQRVVLRTGCSSSGGPQAASGWRGLRGSRQLSASISAADRGGVLPKGRERRRGDTCESPPQPAA